MADTLQFDLVSPERQLASMEATEVQIPGSDGDMTAMADHMPLITTLRPGILKVTGASGAQEFVVSGGFAEITQSSASVLAEQAMPKGDVTAEFLASLTAEAEANRDAATPETLDAAVKVVADLKDLGAELGL